MKRDFFIKEGLKLWYMIPTVTLAKYAHSFVPLIPYRPAAANIMATQNCNSRCVTCSMWRSKSSGELSSDEICDIMNQLKEMGVRRVCFSGGEPTLRPDLPQLIRKAREIGFKKVLITSNGLSLSSDRARELLESGLNRIAISIDGVGDAHDRQRGVKGAFNKSLETVKTLTDLRDKAYPDLDIEVETTITQLNLASFDEVIKLCKELNVSWMVSIFESVSFQFNSIDTTGLVMKDRDGIKKAISRLHHMKRGYSLSPVISHVALDRIERYLNGKTPFDLRSSIPCAAGFTSIYVDACGNVYPGCWVPPAAGNLREKRLKDIINSPEFRAKLKQMFLKQCPTCSNSIIWSAWYYLPTLLEEAGWRLRFLVRNNQGRDI